MRDRALSLYKNFPYRTWCPTTMATGNYNFCSGRWFGGTISIIEGTALGLFLETFWMSACHASF
jgi:hypothetical protein